MWKWIRRYRRRRFQNLPLPKAWEATLFRNAVFRSRLSSAVRQKLDQGIAIFVAEKNFEGCGGLVIDDEHRVTIAAHALRLTLGFDEDYFDELFSILVYPSAYQARSQEFLGSGVVIEGPTARLGEAWYRGPVVLAWDDILRTVNDTSSAHNVVIHEFSHQLDMRNGRFADGVPVIESKAEADEWLRVTEQDFQRLFRACGDGKQSLLDCYGTTNKAEFFAVASEAFFERPHQLATLYPELFNVFRRFYQQDPRLN